MKIQSKVASLANHIFYSTTTTQSEAWKKAWAVIKLREAMQDAVVEFTFIKVSDNSERKANGTLSASIVPQTKGNGKEKPINQITFFEPGTGWRSFKAENLKIAA